MGCDIHGFIEIKTRINGEMKWRFYNHYRINHYHTNGYDIKYEILEIFGRRNYLAFSQLAGVRSSPGDGVQKKLCLNRGLPEDISEEVKTESFRWDMDAHSENYATLKEIMDYNKKIEKIPNHPNELKELEDELIRHALDEFYVESNVVEHADDIRFVFWFEN